MARSEGVESNVIQSGISASEPRAEAGFTDYSSEQIMRRVEQTPLPRNAGSLLREKAIAHPDRVVLHMIDDYEKLTYRDLDTRVTKLASGFHRIGIRHGTHVGVMLHTSAVYPITWLALARLGAVTIPINFSYTPRELDFMLRDSDAEFLVLQQDLLPVLEAIPSPPVPENRTIVVGGAKDGHHPGWEQLLSDGDLHFIPPDEPELDNLMNIQYTSGTTGLPKGAMLTHRSLLTHARVGSAQTQDSCTNLLVAQPFHYITGEWQFLLTVFQGGTAFFPRKQSSSRFMDWVREHQIHYCNFPEIVGRSKPSPEDRNNDLKVLYCYSHQLDCYRQYEARYGCLARQGYSMTEIGITLYVPFEADHMTGTGTVGIPAAFRDVMVADDRGNPVQDDQTGELCVRGPGLMSGYYKRDEATRAAYHPGGWFRTGDVGRRSADGWFWYLGRRRDMVKRSGENVSATEVEAVLRGVEGIEEAAVLPVPDEKRGEEVKAYILLSQGYTKESVPPAQILAHCQRNLAPFKIPRFLEYVPEFPRTPGLKVRKSELIAAKPDLRTGSYDAAERIWR